MKGTCKQDKEWMVLNPGMETCCVLCAMGLSMDSYNVVKDPFTGTVHIDLTKWML